MKKIAIIGSGISGTASAYFLNKLGYDVSLFEAGSYFGGHTNTIDIEINKKTYPVDTGFLVHNDRTYPNLIDFFEELDIATHPSDMTFSVVRESDNIIWAGANLFTVFAQWKNLFSVRFWRFLLEVLDFNKKSDAYLCESEGDLDLTLGELLATKKYSKDFRDWYLLPMGGCIWSTPTDEMLRFPAFTFLRFCKNHGLLQIFNRPQWRTVIGGCQTYVSKALSGINNKFLNTSVLSVENTDKGVEVITSEGKEVFDYCVFSSHPPQTLKIFKTKDEAIKKELNNFKYQKNTAVLHFDEKLLPDRKSAWAAWNYISGKNSAGGDCISVTYLLNMLQPLPKYKQVLVTLNPIKEIDEDQIVKSIDYEHPIFSSEAIKAQDKVNELQGVENVFFCGAWMRYGFHEDGILSAKKMINFILSKDGLAEIKTL